MQSLNKIFLSKVWFAAVGLTAAPAIASSPGDSNVVWYQTPAIEWMEAIPVGNGRLGAMVYGGIGRDRIALNELTLWSGGYDSLQNTICTRENVDEIRRDFFAGDYHAANEKTIKYLTGTRTTFGSNLPLGDLVISSDFDGTDVSGYTRSLDLGNAVASTTFTRGGVKYTRTVICDYPDDILAVEISADRPGAVSASFGFDLLRHGTVTASDSVLRANGDALFNKHGDGGVNYTACVKIVPQGGTLTCSNSTVDVKNADKVTAYIDLRTNMFDSEYGKTALRNVNKASQTGFKTLLANHTADYRNLFNRMDISLGKTANNNLPTDTRLRLIKNGAIDPSFDALFFQYGRYMQIASSRPASPLCSHLQGIWNDNRACQMGWSCDYHLDINIQQNYWAANKANLAETNEPLITYLSMLQKYGTETATKLYGSRGWVAHTVSNPWGYTAPDNAIYWGLNVTGGAWLATHLWSHYKYTLDRDFLARAYPILKGSAEFFSDYMVEEPGTGYLLTGPSISPENGYVGPDGNHYSPALMPTIDRAIVYDIYESVIEGSKILGVDKKLRQKLSKEICRIPPLVTDADGQVKEWHNGCARQSASHRHSSHLLALYPLAQITYGKTPELMKAARHTIDVQTSAPDWEDVEWSAANMLCFNTVLKDSEKAHHWLQDIFHRFTRENLMTVSPKGIAGAEEDIFSFDATEASVAGMCDMLLQSHDGYIDLLPALPSAWADGHVRGICAEGNVTGDISWSDSKLSIATLTANSGGRIDVAHPDLDKADFCINGRSVKPVSASQGHAVFNLKPNEQLSIEIKR